MSGFFNFLHKVPRYEGKPGVVTRLNKRHREIIAPISDEIAGARVLDLAAHDGRWAHAFAGAGAREVLGIEGRDHLVAQYDDFPHPELKARVSLEVGDIFAAMERLAGEGARFDVVGVLGIFYHIMDHSRLLHLIAALGPKLVIIDSEFSVAKSAVIDLVKERTDVDLNAIAQAEGQARAVIGIPSIKATTIMAEAVGYEAHWIDWEAVPKERRGGLGDYYRQGRKRRGTCYLTPFDGDQD